MKKAIVPFIHQLTKEDKLNWLEELQKAMPNINICSTETLSKKERKSVEVSIVANPRSTDLIDLPNLKWVHSLWAGVEHLLDELTNDKISIVRLVDLQLIVARNIELYFKSNKIPQSVSRQIGY